METRKELTELEGRLSKKYVAIESPVLYIIKRIRDRKKIKKKEEIEDLELEIIRAKLKKKLEKIRGTSKTN